MAYKRINSDLFLAAEILDNPDINIVDEMASDAEVQYFYHIGDGDSVIIQSDIAPDLYIVEGRLEYTYHAVNFQIPAGLAGTGNVYFGARDQNAIDSEGNFIQSVEWGPFDVIDTVATAVNVTPSATSVRPEQTRQFTAVFTAEDGLPTDDHSPEAWSIQSGTGGTIDEDTGLFTAGATPEDGTVVLCTSGLLTDTATVNVRNSVISGNNTFKPFNFSPFSH